MYLIPFCYCFDIFLVNFIAILRWNLLNIMFFCEFFSISKIFQNKSFNLLISYGGEI
ncbi:Hypothetical protein CpCap5W_0635 [Corynebacterium pseudotuberculosis]|nr:Hypothetical protein Cp3995_2064 [Corynebacterium pseudotuberculosis 3/99-5]AKC74779.1 Hypothetical protein Cp226_2094 [Corynebacterium pseudotuberculosis]ARS60139.1 Hypothetical protein CpATCC19410_0656 [Corynebacterium pseudotuberculosis]AZN19490.1 hypothetical protein CpCap1W_0631 [Corynebacterium pseudotuberculosis]AZN21591.1 Hypothetical protein CpOviAF1_0629 [Corynebacterium pseudotuberculosis]